MGLSAEALRSAHSGLIVCDISGYGEDGPYRDKKAYDLLIQSEAGFLSVTGTRDEPVKAGCSIADIAAGMYAYSSILAALYARQNGGPGGEQGRGQGTHIDVSMLESLVEWMGYPMYYAFEGASPPQRSGAAHATIYPYGPFAAGDGKVVMLGLQNEREWAAFCAKVLLRPELATDACFANNSKRSAARDALRALVVAEFSTLTAEEVVRRLDDAQIAHAQVNDMKAVWEHPQLRARRRWIQVESPAGRIPALLPPGTDPDTATPGGAVPALGQHSESILGALGYSADAIAKLRAAKAI